MAVMASKYVATFVSARLIGEYKPKEIHKMALTMMPMGEYTLVIGQIGLTITYNGGPSLTPSLFGAGPRRAGHFDHRTHDVAEKP
jgi:Kef-type K+ transport system membrane component KefB